MNLVFTAAKQIARIALLRPILRRLKTRVVRLLIGGLLVFVCGTIGLVLLIAGIRAQLDLLFGTVWSPLAIGAVFVVIAGVSYLVFIKPRNSESVAARTEQTLMQQKVLRPGRRLEREMARRPLINVGTAVGSGFAVAMLWTLLRKRR